MADDSTHLAKVQLYFGSPAGDVEHADEIYEPDAVLEFPQSGERFEGAASFTEWRRRYPSPVALQPDRITVRDDLVVVELTASYDGGPTMYGVSLLEFRGERVARERIYVMEAWEAPAWRRPWRSEEPADSE